MHSILRKLVNWAVNRVDKAVSPLAGMKAPKACAPRRRVLARNLLATLRDRELGEVVSTIAGRTGLDHAPGEDGDRIKLASGRFAMIEIAHGFELVPWWPSLDRHLGEPVS